VISPRGLLDDLLSGGSPAPGCGAAAAVVTTMAAALVADAARRSQECWDGAAGAAAQAERLRHRAAPLAAQDAAAYRDASERLIERTGDFELGRALERAAEVPLEIARVAADVTVLARDVAEQGEPAARADAVGAGFLAEAAAKVAAHLVEINLGATMDDERVVSARSFAAAASSFAGASGK
jgi:methenyltetrahydrofolate cyclohydrolase